MMHDIVVDRKGITRFLARRNEKTYIVTPFLRWASPLGGGEPILQQKHYEITESLSQGVMGEPVAEEWLEVK